MKKRLNLELKILTNLNIHYIYQNNIIHIFSNIGIIYIELNQNYPFSRPNILVSCYSSVIFKYLKKKINSNICFIIISKLQKKFFIKEYISKLLNDNIKLQWHKLFDNFYNNWSPTLWIYKILNIILNINHIPNNNFKLIF